MSINRQRMEQDELEEDILLHSVAGHLQFILSLLQSSVVLQRVFSLVWRLESLLLLAATLALLVTINRRFPQWISLAWISSCISFLPLLVSEGGSGRQDAQEWSEVGSISSIYCMQGRRPNNEDRAVQLSVSCPGDSEGSSPPVHVFAVMDGHGGHFAADYVREHLIAALETRIKQLKLLTSTGNKSDLLRQYEEHFQTAPDSVLKFLKVSRAGQSEEKKDSGEKEESPKVETEDSGEVAEEGRKMSRGGLVLSSREKALEELPSLAARALAKKVPFKPKTPARTPRSGRGKEREGKQEEENKAVDITEYISPAGEILYPKLLKDEVLRCDAQLIVAAKKANAIGGTTLILAVLDSGQLWVANVGDSRAVCGGKAGVTLPMSYDHKPCQLKEKKRIQEAGGFVAMNGVWRVQGVLATSRAMGDYPLKDKKVVVADPDVLSFSVADHRMQFAVLASDGLWDTHSNEEAVAVVRGCLGEGLLGAQRLAQEAYSRGSLDNVTVLVIDLRPAALQL